MELVDPMEDTRYWLRIFFLHAFSDWLFLLIALTLTTHRYDYVLYVYDHNE